MATNRAQDHTQALHGTGPTPSRTSSSTQHGRSSPQQQAGSEENAHPSEQPPETAAMLEKPVAPSFDPPWRRTRVWLILAFYLPLLIVPWTLTCIMTYRPLSAPSYINQAGHRTARDFEVNEGWQVAINVMNTIAAVLTIPVTSLLLAEAAVIWLQRGKRSNAPVPLAQFYDLADRAWTDVTVISKEAFRSGRRANELAGRNWFLLAGAGLVGFCAVVLPLQQLLVRTENMQVITCAHVPYPPDERFPRSCPEAFIAIAEDPQPGMMEVLPLWNVKEQVKARLATDSSSEHQALLWTNTSQRKPSSDTDEGTENDQVLAYYDEDYDGSSFWVSAVPNGTTTGVLRQHAMRMNFSVACEQVPISDFPADCAGDYPFVAEFPWTRGSINGPENFRLSVCVPGSYVVSPWDRTRDASTIQEDMYIGLLPNEGDYESQILRSEAPFVTHCRVNTTRGYFELGNAFNGLLPQPLLERFPDVAESAQYNDYDTIGVYKGNYPPYIGPRDNGSDYLSSSLFFLDMPRGYRINATRYDSDNHMRPAGPLAISAIAIFGNESFFAASERAATSNDSAAAVNLCQNVRMPFLSVDKDDFETYLTEDWCAGIIYAAEDQEEEYDYGYRIVSQLADWFKAFNDTEIAKNAFGISTYYAAEALLTQGANARGGSRKIYSSDGRATQKPTMTLASMIILSLMLAIEVAALVWLGWYIWRTPAWTSTLKSLNVAQLAHAADRGTLPPAGSTDEKDLALLRQTDGRVGLSNTSGPAQQLVHGGPGQLPPSRLRRRNKSDWLRY